MIEEKQIRNGLPLASIARIIGEVSEMRVSNSSAGELKNVLFEISLILIDIAKETAIFSGRKTIKDKDISFAYSQLKKRWDCLKERSLKE